MPEGRSDTLDMSRYDERRRHTRAKVDIGVQWGLTRECLFNDRLTSLSAGGCFIRTDRLTDDGERVYVAMWMPERRVLTGLVRYGMAGVGFGVEFTDIYIEERLTLERLVEDFARAAAR